MIIEKIMKKPVITIGSDAFIKDAMTKTQEYKIRHLPVVDDGKLVGIVSDRDLRTVCPSILCPDETNLTGTVKVKEIMRTQVITCHPLDFIEEAARIVYEYKIGCLPVVRGERVVGIVTETDILRSLVEMMGLLKPGSHLEVEVGNRPGTLAAIASIIRDHGVNIISVLLLPGKSENTQIIVLRVNAIDIRRIIKDMEQAGFKVLWPLQTDSGHEW